MIKVENLSRKYGDFEAVRSLDFEVPKGQIVGLLGHNGAGKTTTLKMLTGFLEPSSGSVTVEGLNVWERSQEIQERLGYLPEMTPLYPDMLLVDYLDYVGKMRGLSEEERPRAIREAMQATDLIEKSLAPIRTLSKGYKQRVGVAQAILHKPEILILDEPTSGLDPSQILAMRHLIKALSKKSTVIISTHIMQEVEAICDRVLIILQGRLVLDSLLEDLRKSKTLLVSVDQSEEEFKPFCLAHPEIEEVSLTGKNGSLYSYELRSHKKSLQDFVPSLAREICSKGWELYAISLQERTLEKVFREVNEKSLGGVSHV